MMARHRRSRRRGNTLCMCVYVPGHETKKQEEEKEEKKKKKKKKKKR